MGWIERHRPRMGIVVIIDRPRLHTDSQRARNIGRQFHLQRVQIPLGHPDRFADIGLRHPGCAAIGGIAELRPDNGIAVGIGFQRRRKHGIGKLARVPSPAQPAVSA